MKIAKNEGIEIKVKTAKANVDVEDRCPERVVKRNSQSMVNSIFNP